VGTQPHSSACVGDAGVAGANGTGSRREEQFGPEHGARPCGEDEPWAGVPACEVEGCDSSNGKANEDRPGRWVAQSAWASDGADNRPAASARPAPDGRKLKNRRRTLKVFPDASNAEAAGR
jgi:hypothetical protein